MSIDPPSHLHYKDIISSCLLPHETTHHVLSFAEEAGRSLDGINLYHRPYRAWIGSDSRGSRPSLAVVYADPSWHQPAQRSSLERKPVPTGPPFVPTKQM